MTPALSVYLDMLRFFTALVVVLHHAWPVLWPEWREIWPGHHAVVVFFVLSGFVIAYVTENRETALREYAIRRIARVWSVAIPALVLAAIIAPFVSPIVPGFSPPYASFLDMAVVNLASLFFVGQLWDLEIVPSLNNPMWSLNYEVWYYAIFGAAHYLRPPWRFPLIAIGLAICGPNILLLMPCWLLGVQLYRHPIALRPVLAWVLIFGSMLGYLILLKFNLPIAIRGWMVSIAPLPMEYLHGANTFLGDWMVAGLVAANLIGVRALEGQLGFLVALRRPMAAAASTTFSIYMYHFALLGLFRFAWGLSPPTTVVALTVSIAVLAGLTERNLPWVRSIIRRAFDRLLGPTERARPMWPRDFAP